MLVEIVINHFIFIYRHNFKTRVATTKMREDLPKDYEIKKQTFTFLLSKAIHDYNVPDELIMNTDETNSLFVPNVKQTKCRGGVKMRYFTLIWL